MKQGKHYHTNGIIILFLLLNSKRNKLIVRCSKTAFLNRQAATLNRAAKNFENVKFKSLQKRKF